MKTNDNKQEPCPKCKSDDTTFHGNWTEDGVLPIPLTTGLDALSPYILSITADNGSIEKTNEFNHTWYDFSIDYNYQLNMDDDNVISIERDPGNMRVLKYFYEENFGELESLEINGVIFEGNDLPECFKIKQLAHAISQFLKTTN